MLITKNPEETQSLGCKMGEQLKPGDVVALFGDLGSGKTCLVQGIAKAFQVKESQVNSPAFTLINEYRSDRGDEGDKNIAIYHIDLYRIRSGSELIDLGLEEYLYGDGICAVEWAERIEEMLIDGFLKVEIFWEGENLRRFEITGIGKRYEGMVAHVGTFNLTPP